MAVHSFARTLASATRKIHPCSKQPTQNKQVLAGIRHYCPALCVNSRPLLQTVPHGPRAFVGSSSKPQAPTQRPRNTAFCSCQNQPKPALLDLLLSGGSHWQLRPEGPRPKPHLFFPFNAFWFVGTGEHSPFYPAKVALPHLHPRRPVQRSPLLPLCSPPLDKPLPRCGQGIK